MGVAQNSPLLGLTNFFGIPFLEWVYEDDGAVKVI